MVFGADGFIGRHLIDELSRSDNFEITAFGKFSAYKTGADHFFLSYKNVRMFQGDFFNRAEVGAALKGADYVFHLISTTNPASSNSDPFIDIDTNIRSSINLFDLCAENKIKKVIFLSSGGTVYGDIDREAIDELTVPQPRSPYGIGKLTIEHYLRYFKFMTGLRYVVYRVGNPYGPGQNIHGKQGVIPIFMRRILTGEPLTVFGKGDMIRDYIYISDLTRMIVASFQKRNRYSEYNLGSGQGISVNELITALESTVGHKIKKVGAETPATYIRRSVLDIERFTSEFNVRPTISLQDGLKKTWNHVKEIS